MRYLSYEEFLEIGGLLSNMEFERVIDMACRMIDFKTMNRLRGAEKISDSVKACVRELCEVLADRSRSGENVISSRSQSAGGVSESENYVVKTADDVKNDANDIICDFLASETDDNGTPLLYRGASK